MAIRNSPILHTQSTIFYFYPFLKDAQLSCLICKISIPLKILTVNIFLRWKILLKETGIIVKNQIPLKYKYKYQKRKEEVSK